MSRQTMPQLVQSATELDPRLFFFSPEELSSLSVSYFDYITAHPGMKWDVGGLDRSLLPWRLGTVIGLIARPGHGKTTLAVAKARITAQQIVREGRQDKECVLYVSLDQAVEELETLFLAGDGFSATEFMETTLSRDLVVSRAMQRPRLPVYLMGRSVLRKRRTPRFTIERIYEGISAMHSSFGVVPRLVIVDYIQIVPVQHAKERSEQVSEAIVRGGELALAVPTCILFNAQASRAVDSREDPIPTMADCQHSSALEQESDVLLAVNRPWLNAKENRDYEHPRPFTLRGQHYNITPDLFLLRVEKQRFKKANVTLALRLSPEFVELADAEALAVGAAGAPPATQGGFDI